MDYGPRTVFRHFGIAGLLVGTLFTVFSAEKVLLPWMRANALFLGGWLAIVILLGILADRAVRYEWPDRLLARLRGPNAKESRFAELFHKWGGCSRCVGYWSGAVFSFVATALYFPSPLPGSVYFLFLGASTATGVAVSAHLWRTREQDKPDET